MIPGLSEPLPITVGSRTNWEIIPACGELGGTSSWSTQCASISSPFGHGAWASKPAHGDPLFIDEGVQP